MNTITIELCAEDRARLDRLAEALERKACDKCASDALKHCAPKIVTPEERNAIFFGTEAPTATQKTPEAQTEESVNPTEEVSPAVAEPAPAPAETAEPSVTLEQIQKKVVQLAAANGGAKKPKVREIISNYGAKVSDLKDCPEKWTEVWERLTALESEA